MPREKESTIKLPSLDDLFSSQEEREDAKLKRIHEIPLDQIDPFPDHPYKVRNDEEMVALVESVKENGVITPATVRKKEDGRYELLSGHRRMRACMINGIDTLRCEVVDMDRLIVGLPFYSRLWYENKDGTVGRETGDMNFVEEYAQERELTFTWMSDVGYDYAEYEAEESTALIWYENARSLEAKLNVLSRFEIAGVAYWRLGQETADVWDTLERYY